MIVFPLQSTQGGDKCCSLLLVTSLDAALQTLPACPPLPLAFLSQGLEAEGTSAGTD
jgi:hypothetical protein